MVQLPPVGQWVYNRTTPQENLSGKIIDKTVDKETLSGKITDKIRLSGKFAEKLPITDVYIDKITDIYVYIQQHPHSTAEDIALFTGRSKESAKKYLQALVTIQMIAPEGGNKNRTYSINQE